MAGLLRVCIGKNYTRECQTGLDLYYGGTGSFRVPSKRPFSPEEAYMALQLRTTVLYDDFHWPVR